MQSSEQYPSDFTDWAEKSKNKSENIVSEQQVSIQITIFEEDLKAE